MLHPDTPTADAMRRLQGDSPPSGESVMESATPALQHGTTSECASIPSALLKPAKFGRIPAPMNPCAPVARTRQATVLLEGRMMGRQYVVFVVALLLFCAALRQGCCTMCCGCFSRGDRYFSAGRRNRGVAQCIVAVSHGETVIFPLIRWAPTTHDGFAAARWEEDVCISTA